jgi:hypothetical protein
MEYVGGRMKVDEMCVGEVFGFMRLKVGKEHTHTQSLSQSEMHTYTHTLKYNIHEAFGSIHIVAHTTHSCERSTCTQNVQAVHSVHTHVPCLSQYLPGVQGRQSPTLLFPLAPEKDPGSQGVGIIDPDPQKCPGVHRK